MFNPDVVEPLSIFFRLIEDLRISCVVGGSVASSLQGMPRQTIDLGVVVVLPPEKIREFVDAAAPHFYVSESAVREAVAYREAFNLIHAQTGFKVDVYVSGDSEFDRAQFERASLVRLPGLEHHPILVASPEDVILRKLDWYRLGHQVSDRQWYDLSGVMKVQAGRLDDEYLDRWATHLGLTELLARARRESSAG